MVVGESGLGKSTLVNLDGDGDDTNDDHNDNHNDDDCNDRQCIVCHCLHCLRVYIK